ncbi:beta-carotene 15,15'-monooxygenase [Amycolatopsis sp. WAC 04182]|uniref:VUT family protein n=1 Tax=Amycolatopsis sp. WAC 04182 TaxID=2203198 RepID=UPI000F792FFD|nr:VUT family protein [Amycolatopsis sp. WAC 04182]RSN61512.1 beta-carotene 15,15'-monooxygenase [Amycolatopsis sp. WAC 04182]
MTIATANWANSLWPAVTIGGLRIPAGALVTGLVFTMRDLLQDAAGTRMTLLAVVLGAALSSLTSDPRIALASAAAFAVSELADLAVYTPLRRRSPLAAAGLSNATGLFVDTVLFLPLAFGSLDQLSGQLVGKAATTIPAVALLSLARRRQAPP